MTVFIFSYLRYEDIKLGRQDSKILTCVFSERYGFGWFAFLVIFSVFFFFPKCLEKCNIITVRTKKKKKFQKSLCFTWQSGSWLGEHLNHTAVFVQINMVWFLWVSQKNEMFLRDLSVYVFAWARKHRHKYTCFFLLRCPRIFGSLAPGPEFQLPPPKQGASCVCETQAAAPTGEDTPQLPAPSQRKPPCVHRPPHEGRKWKPLGKRAECL